MSVIDSFTLDDFILAILSSVNDLLRVELSRPLSEDLTNIFIKSVLHETSEMKMDFSSYSFVKPQLKYEDIYGSIFTTYKTLFVNVFGYASDDLPSKFAYLTHDIIKLEKQRIHK